MPLEITFVDTGQLEYLGNGKFCNKTCSSSGQSMNILSVAPWSMDWVWSIPLIVFTVPFHAFVLRLVNRGVNSLLEDNGKKSFNHILSVVVVGGPALCATFAHGFEAWLWSVAYCFSGAIPDQKAAMEFSLGAMTTFGNNTLRLESRFQLMGPLEALSGWILFGLTTAFLFTIIRKVWSTEHWA